jgi:hypothetical protein
MQHVKVPKLLASTTEWEGRIATTNGSVSGHITISPGLDTENEVTVGSDTFVGWKTTDSLNNF